MEYYEDESLSFWKKMHTENYSVEFTKKAVYSLEMKISSKGNSTVIFTNKNMPF